jgi:hypothetical protein
MKERLFLLFTMPSFLGDMQYPNLAVTAPPLACLLAGVYEDVNVVPVNSPTYVVNHAPAKSFDVDNGADREHPRIGSDSESGDRVSTRLGRMAGQNIAGHTVHGDRE